MPQLDQFTYLTQFVWLCVFYMTFYILLFNDGLPKISRILKLRAYLCADHAPDADQGHEGLSALTSKDVAALSGPAAAGKIEVSAGSQDVVFRTLNSSISILKKSVTGAFNWLKESIDSLNANQLKTMNKSYLRSIGEISLSQLIKKSALEASAPLTFSSHSSLFLELSKVWALRVQKCLRGSINKKKKKK